MMALERAQTLCLGSETSIKLVERQQPCYSGLDTRTLDW
jgi:hypothetical protein